MAKRCPACESFYGDSIDRCPEDNTALEQFDSNEDPLSGQVIDDRFRLEELLGAGGMGRVYRGVQLSVDRDVAVKLLRGEAVPNRSMNERFLREARVISGFSHPNIIRLIEFGHDEDRGAPYLVMELAGGVSLADLVGSGRLHATLAVEIARQVCSGLLEAHGENIIHRDLKPDNLHLIANSDGSFHVKILDFGIAFPQESSKNLTATGMMCGTAPYVSPEQARSEDLEAQADLYSLGIILFEMLSGIRPFQGESGFEIIMQQVNEPPPDLRQYVPPGTLPDELVDLVYDLLEKSAGDRPSGARPVRDRLDAIGDELDRGIDLDLSGSGVGMYEPWLLEAVPSDAPLHESDTLTQDPDRVRDERETSRDETDSTEGPSAAEPPKAPGEPERQSRGAPREEPSTADSSESDGTADAAGGPPAARRSQSPERSTTAEADMTTESGGWGRPLAVAAGIGGLAVLVAAGVAVGVSLTGDEGGESDATSDDPGASAPDTDTSGQERASLEPISGSLNEVAGRCVVVGSSDTDFHTVYFFPEIGEILMRGEAEIRWSKLELAGRRGGRIYFRYGNSDSEQPGATATDGSVRKSADKRIFEFDRSGEFVCRREAYGAYYTDLELEGTWEPAEGDGRLEFPDGGQQFSVGAPREETDAGPGRRTHEYRLLDGAPDGSELLLAVRPVESESGWRPWKLEHRPDERVLMVTRNPDREDAEARKYRPPDADSGSGGRAARSPSSGTSGGAPADPGDSTGATEPTGTDRPEKAGAPAPAAESGGSSGELLDAWKTRFEKIRDKCSSAAQTIKNNNQRYQELIDQDKMERAREFSDTMQKENKEAGERMRKAGQEFSALVTEMTQSGVGAARIQKMSREYSNACKIE